MFSNTRVCEMGFRVECPTLRHCDLAGVALAPNGDFRVDDTLDPVPSERPSPVLLIRNIADVWFAAGIPALEDDDER
jgi:hypothetical protein